MTAPTHISFAGFIYLLILTTTGISLNLVNASIIAVSSILPDIDTGASTVGKIVPFISTNLERKYGHRTLTHSAVFVVALGVILLPIFLYNRDMYVCLIVGYASHPFLDTMTVNGVKMFYPFSSVKCVFPFEVNNPHRYRLQTGSKMDKMLGVIFLIGCIPTFVIAYAGYERFVRAAQQNIEAAVRDYNEFSKDHLVVAEVEAYSALTKQSLKGSIEIIGALNPHILVFKGSDGRPHTLGKEFQADYVVESILCSKGEAAHSAIRNVDLSNQLVSQVASFIDTSAENYFFGDLTTSDKVSLPENIKLFTPITGGGSTIRFNFATLDDIRTFNLEYVYVSKGILTIKSISTHQFPKNVEDVVIPKLDNFTQISIAVDAKESITFMKGKGDTTHVNELLALKNSARFFQDEIDLNWERIASLKSESVSSIFDLDQKIANTEQAVRLDSAEYANLIELMSKHYLSGGTLQGSDLKWKKEKQVLSGLVASRTSQLEKASIAIRRLEVQNAELASKASAAQLHSEIRSTVNGILVDIRQVPHNNKTQVTFIIRRIN